MLEKEKQLVGEDKDLIEELYKLMLTSKESIEKTYVFNKKCIELLSPVCRFINNGTLVECDVFRYFGGNPSDKKKKQVAEILLFVLGHDVFDDKDFKKAMKPAVDFNIYNGKLLQMPTNFDELVELMIIFGEIIDKNLESNNFAQCNAAVKVLHTSIANTMVHYQRSSKEILYALDMFNKIIKAYDKEEIVIEDEEKFYKDIDRNLFVEINDDETEELIERSSEPMSNFVKEFIMLQNAKVAKDKEHKLFDKKMNKYYKKINKSLENLRYSDLPTYSDPDFYEMMDALDEKASKKENSAELQGILNLHRMHSYRKQC